MYMEHQSCEITRCLEFQIEGQKHTNQVNKTLLIIIVVMMIGTMIGTAIAVMSVNRTIREMTASYNQTLNEVSTNSAQTLQSIVKDYFGYDNPTIEQSQSIGDSSQELKIGGIE